MTSDRCVLCADHTCKHNNGGGYYGICKNPVVNHPIYTGGVDRLLMNTCQLRQTNDGKIIITGGARGCGKSDMVETAKKVLEDKKVDYFEINRRTGKSGSHGL